MSEERMEFREAIQAYRASLDFLDMHIEQNKDTPNYPYGELKAVSVALKALDSIATLYGTR